MFVYAVPESGASDEVLSMLDREIRQAEFTSLTAEEVQARVKAVRPWWRVW